MAENATENEYRTEWPVYAVEDRAEIGDLMGAIHGIRYVGFIGEVYRHYPFPQKPEAFKQRAEGYLNQAVVRDMIAGYARQIKLPIVAGQPADEVAIGEYVFSSKTFQEMIRYVWRGGYPGWQNDLRPDDVVAMKATIEIHRQGLFTNIQWVWNKNSNSFWQFRRQIVWA